MPPRSVQASAIIAAMKSKGVTSGLISVSLSLCVDNIEKAAAGIPIAGIDSKQHTHDLAITTGPACGYCGYGSPPEPIGADPASRLNSIPAIPAGENTGLFP